MGALVNGEWVVDERGLQVPGGALFQDRITPPGAGGEFPAEAGRYHLYASSACPFSHRALIMRALKGLEDQVTLSLTHPVKHDQGWTFEDHPKTVGDPVFGAARLYQVFTAAQPGYTGRCAVPVLLDKQTKRIVSNDSAAILRMLATAFDELGARPSDTRPAALAAEIDALNQEIADKINSGVYAIGFARDQASYEAAVHRLFGLLDRLDGRLARQRYLFGAGPCESDWFLLPTLLRFDVVYVPLFKCSLRRIADYAQLPGYLRDLYQLPGVAETVDMAAIKEHYFKSHIHGPDGPVDHNPSGLIPLGPELDFTGPHERAHMS